MWRKLPTITKINNQQNEHSGYDITLCENTSCHSFEFDVYDFVGQFDTVLVGKLWPSGNRATGCQLVAGPKRAGKLQGALHRTW